jgi:hypothetical protein
MDIKTLSRICILFFLSILVSYIFIGIKSKPTEGDSIGYHIPIAKSYLDGKIFTPEKIQGAPFLKYSPATSEGILSVFYLLRIPPNLYNVIGVVFLFFSLLLLGKNFGIEKNLSIIFATSIVTLNGIVRWMDTQIIDIYLSAFFVLSLSLLQKPEKKVSYFLKLGFVMGMLVGSKYSGLLFAGVLLLVYGKKLITLVNLKSFLLFPFCFLLLGGSWYLRNYFITGNPTYPQGFLFFKDAGFTILSTQVWKVVISSSYGFFGTLNALISEYMIWVLSVPIVLFFIALKRKDEFVKKIFPLVIIGVLNIFIYLFLPSDNKDYIMVSVIRYSYVAIIPFILAIFLLAKKYHKEEYIAVTAIGNMLFLGFPLQYNPKLVFIFIPIALLYFFKKRD